MTTIFQAEGLNAPSNISLAATIIASADAIEISMGPERIVMYTWDEEHRTWRALDENRRVGGTALWEAINLARAAGLTVVAWNDGRRLV